MWGKNPDRGRASSTISQSGLTFRCKKSPSPSGTIFRPPHHLHVRSQRDTLTVLRIDCLYLTAGLWLQGTFTPLSVLYHVYTDSNISGSPTIMHRAMLYLLFFPLCMLMFNTKFIYYVQFVYHIPVQIKGTILTVILCDFHPNT